MTKLLLSLFLLIPNLNLINVPGFHSVTLKQAQQIFILAQKNYFTPEHVALHVKYLNSKNPCAKYHTLDYRNLEIECLAEYTSKRRKTITYWMTPPFYANNTAWIAGVAISVCGRVATGNAEMTQFSNGIDTKTSRVPHSAVIIAHEINHLLCATHKDRSPNLMNFQANAYTDLFGGVLPILPSTIREVKRGYALLNKDKL